MLNTTKKLNTLFGALAATLALTVSIPHSGSNSLISTAYANDGGGGAMDNISPHTRRPGAGFRNGRSFSKVFFRPGPNARQRAASRARNAARRAARRARIARAEARAAARRGPAAARRHAALVARAKAREARRVARAKARAAQRRAVAERMRARRAARGMMRDARRMFGMDFNNDFVSTTDAKTGRTTTLRRDRFGNIYTAAPNPNPNVVPVAAPVAPAAPARNTPWASSTNPATGITTTSVPNGVGGHTVTLTGPAGNVVNQFTTNW
ncbi:MAG: hypothetical protein C0605_15920 [Hyphomicrobiales bacterium]|nr:MAG: hypothetical protein C0605_15920 [Hyphomicrobiales bacterium]